MGFELAVAAVVAVAVQLVAVAVYLNQQYFLVFLRLLFCNAVFSCETAVSHENAVSCESAISCESRRESQLTYRII